MPDRTPLDIVGFTDRHASYGFVRVRNHCSSGLRSSHPKTLTLEHAAETLAQYRVAVEADGRLRDVVDPRFFPTCHGSPQPFLTPLEDTEWHPAQRLAPYRPRCKRVAAEQQAPLLEPDRESACG